MKKKKIELIEKYITELYAEENITVTADDLKKLNEICKTVDNIGSFSEFELNAIVDEIKDNNELMGMLERVIDKMNLVSKGVKIHEYFKIFEPLWEKRKALRGINDIRQFQDSDIFSHTLQNTVFDISWSMRMKILKESII